MSLSIPKYSIEDGFNVAALKARLAIVCDMNVETIGASGWADALLNITASINRLFNG